jgi:Virulence-associated protein E
MLDPVTWNLYARGLKNLCAKYELHADPSRTADISSVLRTPGTHNRKHRPERPVEITPRFLEIKPYSLDHFAMLLEHADAPSVGEFLSWSLPARLTNRARPARRIAEQLSRGLTAHKPASGLLVAEKCEQVRALRDSKGCIPEPLWYAVLGVLALCEDGDKLGQEWSSGYDNYTERETQERLNRARSLTGATTCRHFHGLKPNVCERCLHWGTDKFSSPIVLGTQQEVPQTANGQASAPADGPLPMWEMQGKAKKPKSYINTVRALAELQVKCRHDIFHNKKIIEGDVAENLGPELSDAICRALRDLIIAKFCFDPGIENVQQAAERACEATRFDPVFDYLNPLQWDAHPRLDAWLATYLGADDTPLNRSIGRKMLIAAVRRARQPGCKFDYVVVLEGKQGTGKSSALRILAGEENFSDQPLLHLETRAQQEAIEGVWIFELSELAGLRRTEIETVKSFLSKTADNARPAYGRYRSDRPRRCIFVGTTNEFEYLRDATGNRRFWPVRTVTIDLGALRRDRDQLWAEATAAEARGEALVIEDDLYQAVAAQQEERMLNDPWDDILAQVKGEVLDTDGVERISSEKLLTVHLQLKPDHIYDATTKRLGACMRRLGWAGPKKMRFATIPKQGYWRQKPST